VRRDHTIAELPDLEETGPRPLEEALVIFHDELRSIPLKMSLRFDRRARMDREPLTPAEVVLCLAFLGSAVAACDDFREALAPRLAQSAGERGADA
jgi:hypothetical protein